MSGLVEQLRQIAGDMAEFRNCTEQDGEAIKLMRETADEITRLKAENSRFRKTFEWAPRPLHQPDSFQEVAMWLESYQKWFEDARAALNQQKDTGDE